MGFLLGIDPKKLKKRLAKDKSLPEGYNFNALENRAYQSLFALVDKLKNLNYDLPLEEVENGLKLNGNFAHYRHVHLLIERYLQLFMYVSQQSDANNPYILLNSFKPDIFDIRGAIGFIDLTKMYDNSNADAEFYNRTVSIQYLIFLATMLSMNVDLLEFKKRLKDLETQLENFEDSEQ